MFSKEPTTLSTCLLLLVSSSAAAQAVAQQPSVDEDVVIASSMEGVDLGCTWTRPTASESGSSGIVAAAVLLSVAGPDDRHQTVGPHRLFADLAEGLAAKGIASLRCDDPGVGESGGDWLAFDYSTRADDALLMMDWIAERSGIERRRIGLIGNSEGGAVGPLAAVAAPERVGFVVLLAGPGVPAEVSFAATLESSIERLGLGETFAENLRTKFGELVRIMGLDPTLAETRAAMKTFIQSGGGQLIPPYRFVPRDLDGLTDFLLSPWYRGQFQYQPTDTLAQVRAPILAMTGSKDTVLPAAVHLPAIREALSSNAGAVVRELEGINHVFQAAKTGAATEYATLKEGFSAEVIQIVAEFVLGVGDG